MRNRIAVARPSLLVALACVLTTLTTNAWSEACDFRCTLERHLTAIQERDMGALVTTITEDDALTLLYPSGQFFRTRAEYIEQMELWFAQGPWTFEHELIRIIETDDFSLALLKCIYREPDRDGQPYRSDFYLNLSFQKQNGGWRLVHDQNTKIQTDS